ncbi:MAG TPA: universal stress protein [Polyangiaceae bacterium]|nr:universal stress protein [Polyangiaceae bacterium]
MDKPSKPFVAVVGYDFSELADLALDQCLDVVSRHPEAEVHVVYVVPAVALTANPLAAALPSAVSGDVLDDTAARLKKAVDDRLAHYVKTHQPLTCRVVSHLRVDETASCIAQLAADLESDILVVGTHSRRGVARLLLGSVAQSVIALAPCPVLVVRPKRIEAHSPAIEPPCPRCVETRQATQGAEFWCEQHRERHGRRHTYHQDDRTSSDSTLPLVVH